MSAVRALIDALVAGGMDPAEAAVMVAQAAVEANARLPSKGAERTRRWRENKRHKPSPNVTGDAPSESVTNRHRTSQTVTSDAQEETALSSSLSSESQEQPRKEEKKKERAKRNRGSVLPADWRPSDAHFREGADLGLARSGVIGMAEDMRLWARANEHRAVARKSDWDLTFSAWMRRESGKSRSTGPPQRQQQPSWHELEAELRNKANGQATDNHTETEPLEGELFPPLRSVG